MAWLIAYCFVAAVVLGLGAQVVSVDDRFGPIHATLAAIFWPILLPVALIELSKGGN